MMADPPPLPPLLALPAEMQLAICDALVACHADIATPEETDDCTPAWDPADDPEQPDVSDQTWESTLENYVALGNLARTCRHFYRLTIPMLYERVKVSIYRPVAFVQLVRHFSRSTHLGLLAKELTINSSQGISALPMSLSQSAFVLQEGQRLGLRCLPKNTGLSHEIDSVMIDVLLCQVPAIKKLTISLPQRPYSITGRFGPALSYAVRLPESFTLGSLRHIEAHPPYNLLGEDGMNGAFLTALLRHTPAVALLRVGPVDPRTPQEIVQSSLPELWEAHLYDMRPTALGAFAKFCPQLQWCRTGPRVAHPPARCVLNRNLKTPPGLLPLTFPLRVLDIGCYLSSPSVTELELLYGLPWFRSLWYFHFHFGEWSPYIPAMLIDNLPPTLDSFCVGGFGVPIYDVAVLLHRRLSHGRLPNLKSFTY